MEDENLELIWEELVMKNNTPCLFVNVLRENNKIKDIIINEKNKSWDILINNKNVIGESLYKILELKKNNRIYRAIDEGKSIVFEYVKVLELLYIIKIQHIIEDDFIIWMYKKVAISEAGISYFKNNNIVIYLNDKNGEKILSYERNYQISKEKDTFIVDPGYNENYSNIEDNYYEEIEFTNGRAYHSMKYPVEFKNEIIGLLGLNYDITEIYKREEKTGYINKILELILDTTPDLICYLDNKGKLLYANKVLRESLGIKRKDFFKVYLNKFLINKNIKILNKSEGLSESTNFTKFVQINNKNRKYEVVKAPFNIKDKQGGIINIARDITKMYEEKNIIKKLKIDFFSNLSHELKTPLNIIYISSQTLRKKLERNNEIQEYDKYIKVIDKNIFRLLRLISNLIDLNKADSKSLLFICKNYDIVFCIETIVELANEYVLGKDIHIIFDTNIEECIVAFDIHKMERIIMNLISNSIKFNKDKIEVFISLQVNKDLINISVKDNGIGIPEDKQDEIFEKFGQVNRRFTKINEGSSLGLSIVKDFIEMHKGKIKVEYSEIDKGTEVSIEIPNRRLEEESKTDYLSYRESCWDRLKIEFSDIYLP